VQTVIFARAPAPGAVKTRLEGIVGPHLPAELAGAFLRDTWDALGKLAWMRSVVATTAPLGEAFEDMELWNQGGGDLGKRLERNLQRALRIAPVALALGADTPGLPTVLLEQASDAIGRADAVVGPARDGGFYLLALRDCPDGLFDSIPWSSSLTGALLLQRLEQHGLRTTLLDEWFDVDRPQDLLELRGLLERGQLHAPASWAILRDLDLDEAAEGLGA
jgi:hypothetical protein